MAIIDERAECVFGDVVPDGGIVNGCASHASKRFAREPADIVGP